MNLEQKYKEETGFDVGKIHEIGTTYYSDDYVKWLEKAIDVIQCCKSVKITEKQENIEAITALTEVVKANNKLFGSERTMEIANSKIKELMQQL